MIRSNKITSGGLAFIEERASSQSKTGVTIYPAFPKSLVKL